jgi:hypothetical protein
VMRRKFLNRIGVLVLLMSSGIASAQTGMTSDSTVSVSSEGRIVVDVFAAAEVPATRPSSDSARLSQNFKVSAMKAASALSTWQRHLEYTIKNGYPPSEIWMVKDHDQSAEALNIAAATASNDAEQLAVQQLASVHEYLRLWSQDFLKAYNQMRMAQYYMSPAALAKDVDFQRAAACTESLSGVLQSGHLSDGPVCR